MSTETRRHPGHTTPICTYCDVEATRNATVDVVFDGPPGPVAGRFVEVEGMDGASVSVGEWIDRGDGFWALRLTLAETAQSGR